MSLIAPNSSTRAFSLTLLMTMLISMDHSSPKLEEKYTENYHLAIVLDPDKISPQMPTFCTSLMRIFSWRLGIKKNIVYGSFVVTH